MEAKLKDIKKTLKTVVLCRKKTENGVPLVLANMKTMMDFGAKLSK